MVFRRIAFIQSLSGPCADREATPLDHLFRDGTSDGSSDWELPGSDSVNGINFGADSGIEFDSGTDPYSVSTVDSQANSEEDSGTDSDSGTNSDSGSDSDFKTDSNSDSGTDSVSGTDSYPDSGVDYVVDSQANSGIPIPILERTSIL